MLNATVHGNKLVLVPFDVPFKLFRAVQPFIAYTTNGCMFQKRVERLKCRPSRPVLERRFLLVPRRALFVGMGDP